MIVHGDSIIYSDWISETISLLKTDRDQKIDLAIGAMRPTQMALHYTGTPGKMPFIIY